jgi:hypothetical protein
MTHENDDDSTDAIVGAAFDDLYTPKKKAPTYVPNRRPTAYSGAGNAGYTYGRQTVTYTKPLGYPPKDISGILQSIGEGYYADADGITYHYDSREGFVETLWESDSFDILQDVLTCPELADDDLSEYSKEIIQKAVEFVAEEIAR